MSLRAPLVGWIVLALLALAVPAQAAPVSGELNMAGGALLEGDITWTGTTRLLDLEADGGIPAFSIDATGAQAEVFVERQTSEDALSFLLGDSIRQANTVPELLHDASLTELLLGETAHITLDMEDVDAQARTQAAALDAASEVYASVDPHDQRRFSEPAYDYSIAGADWITARSAGIRLDADGSFTLALWDAEITIASSEGERTYRAGSWSEDSSGPAPTRQQVLQIVWIEFQAAYLSVDWAGKALLAGPAPRIDIDGTTTMTSTRGALQVDNLGIKPDAQNVVITGAYALGPRVDPSAEAGNAPLQELVSVYDRFDSGVRGDAAHVTVEGTPIVIPDSGMNGAVAAGAAGIGLLAFGGVLYRWGPLAFAALYSRLEEGELLNNDTRAQIYEIVKKNPGISARQIHRLSTASWGTVVHHLHKLQHAGYVATLSHGRAKCYYENHGKWDAFQEQLAVLTGDKTAAVADAIAAVPGRDQNQIIDRTGFSQSTVSYHLLKLEKAGLVSKERTGSCLAYFPTAALRDLRARLPGNSLPSDAGAVGGAA